MILIFAGGLADEMVHTYDGSGYAPRLDHGQIRTASEIELMRRDIERVYNRVSTVTDIARFLHLDVSEVEDQLQFMTKSTLYDVKWGGYDLLAPYR